MGWGGEIIFEEGFYAVDGGEWKIGGGDTAFKRKKKKA